jgi:sRNA-binding protein
MIKPDFDAQWRGLSEEVLSEVKEWRMQHPRATLSEMEAALDERLARQRARMLEDMALASEVADLRQVPMEERPTCPHCDRPLGARGKEERHLQTVGDQELTLNRSYGVCPTCEVGFFPSGR